MNVPSGYTALGLIGFTDQGVYNSATAYVRNDIVHYNGNLWRCLVDDTTAVTPAEGANWTVYLAEPTSAAEDIIAPVEATATSTRIYAIGDQLILADVLYDVTQAINIGDTLTVGTNIAAADTIVEQIAEKANSADLATVATSGAYSDLSGKPTLGTAAAKNVPASGDASTTEVVMGDDTRLTNARNAADVSAWAKAANKPIYNGSEIKTSTAKTGTAQQSISDTVTSGTSMDNVVGTMLDNDKTLDTNVTSLKETFTNNGAHNLLPMTLSSIKEANTGGTWSGNVYTVNGGTFTVNTDANGDIASIQVDGTFSATSYFRLVPDGDWSRFSGMLLNGCAPGGTQATSYSLEIVQKVSPYTRYGQNINANSVSIGTIPTSTTQIYIRIASGYTANNILFRPMIRLASDTDATYTPYAKTNQQLTQEITGLLDNVNVMGVKNFVKLGVSAVSKVVNGITFVVNADNSITASTGSSGATAATWFEVSNALTLEAGRYFFTGQPKGVAGISMYLNSTFTGSEIYDAGGYGTTFTITEQKTGKLFIKIDSGKVLTTPITFKPLVQLASNTDHTYVPYAMSNRELTDRVSPILPNSHKQIYGSSTRINDCDNAERDVWYYVYGSSQNTPDTTKAGLLITHGSEDNVEQQIFFSTNGIWIRGRENGPWDGSWKKLI